MYENDTFLKQVSGILLRSFIVSMAFLILWLGIYFLAGNFWFASHTKLFNITHHELSLINYAGMGLFKILAFCFLLGPYLALKTMGR